MLELEFLPRAYTRLNRRRRIVTLQVWLALLVAAGLALWLHLADTNAQAAGQSLEWLSRQLSQSNEQLAQMERLESLGKQLRQKAEVLERLGVHLDSSRLMARLSEAMPTNVALVSIHLDVDDPVAQAPASIRPASRDATKARPPRRLKVRLQGVAPTDVELATFLTELNRARFLENVTPSYVRDRRDGPHVLREFELSFAVELDPARS